MSDTSQTTPRATPRTNPFWDFSLALYASPAVQKACLELQDGDGVDVNVMLFALYLASTGRTLSQAEVRHLVASIEPWKAGVVVPLRTARRNLKEPPAAFDANGAEALRAIVKQAELEAERLQQSALFGQVAGLDSSGLGSSLGQPAAPREAAKVNMTAYGAAIGRQLANGPVGVMLAAFEAQLAKGAGGTA